MIDLKENFIITEGIEGYWFYHISNQNNFTKSLCGKNTMKCGILPSSWGLKSHLKERYCSECEQLMNK